MLKLDVSTFLTCPNMSRYFWRFEHLGGKIHMCSAEAEEVGCLRFEVGFWGWQSFSTKEEKRARKKSESTWKTKRNISSDSRTQSFKKWKYLGCHFFITMWAIHSLPLICRHDMYVVSVWKRFVHESMNLWICCFSVFFSGIHLSTSSSCSPRCRRVFLEKKKFSSTSRDESTATQVRRPCVVATYHWKTAMP